MRFSRLLPVVAFALLAFVGTAIGSEQASPLGHVIEVQQYSRAIHIMAMLLVGFGFLMVFVKKYGRTAVTATYLLVSISIPLYFLKRIPSASSAAVAARLRS